MGEFRNEFEDTATTQEPTQEEPTGFDTDVPEVKANDLVRKGQDDFPVFDVSGDEFYQNMQYGRKRLRFKSGTNAQKYMQGSKYQRPFYIRHTDSNGKKYVRKID